MQLISLVQKSPDLPLRREILFLEAQRIASRLFFVLTGALCSFFIFKIMKFKVKNLKEIRQKFQEFTNDKSFPQIICCNHLTYIDSLMQVVFVSSPLSYLFSYKKLPWHLPEKKNFYHNWRWKFFCYIGKCIPVTRQGTPIERRTTLNKIRYILNRGDIISIFPEGRRGVKGIIDTTDFSYAVGEILKKTPTTNVIFLYMRDKNGQGHCKYPLKGGDYYLDLAMTKISSIHEGKRKVKDISEQIIQHLKSMENKYFNA